MDHVSSNRYRKSGMKGLMLAAATSTAEALRSAQKVKGLEDIAANKREIGPVR
jgi:hypothetical protein